MGYNIKDDVVSQALNRFDTAAEDVGIDYALGGGLAVQSYLVEGIAEIKGTSVEELSQGDISPHLRSTGDLDIPVRSYGQMPELGGSLFVQGEAGGDISKKDEGKYFGELELGGRFGRESIDLNIFNGEAQGFSERQFNEQFDNSNRYEDGQTSFDRVGLENIVWMKADGKREKDIVDLAYLMQLRSGDVDDEYVHELIEDDEETRAIYEKSKDEAWREEILDQLSR